MNEFFDWSINIPFKNQIVSGLIGGIITCSFTLFKMKKDRKMEFEKAMGAKIPESLYYCNGIKLHV